MNAVELKKAVGYRAAEFVGDGQRLGLGTGSTVHFYLERLGERIRTEGLRVAGIPTSLQTETEAKAFGIPLTTLEETPELDLYVDGADEIDPEFRMIKGGGGALLREKIIASASREKVIIVDESKLVDRLGVRFALPVEVVPFGLRFCEPRIRGLGCRPVLRMKDGAPFVTNNGNLILDCSFAGGIQDPAVTEAALNAIPGVVCAGLFIGLADVLLVGSSEGVTEKRRA